MIQDWRRLNDTVYSVVNNGLDKFLIRLLNYNSCNSSYLCYKEIVIGRKITMAMIETTGVNIRQSEFRIKVIGYSGNLPIVVYEVTEPAEVYTLPNGYANEIYDPNSSNSYLRKLL